MFECFCLPDTWHRNGSTLTEALIPCGLKTEFNVSLRDIFKSETVQDDGTHNAQFCCFLLIRTGCSSYWKLKTTNVIQLRYIVVRSDGNHLPFWARSTPKILRLAIPPTETGCGWLRCRIGSRAWLEQGSIALRFWDLGLSNILASFPCDIFYRRIGQLLATRMIPSLMTSKRKKKRLMLILKYWERVM